MQVQSSQTSQGKPADASELTRDLTASLHETAAEVAPWFQEVMPRMYFQDTDHATQLVHLRAIVSAKASGRPIVVMLRNQDGSEYTLMRPLDAPGVLAEIVAELPHGRPLRAAKIHTATDGRLVIDTFEFGEAERFDASDPAQLAKLEATIAHAATHDPPYGADEIREHFERCSNEYILTLTPLRLCEHLQLFREVSGTDGSAVVLEPETDPTQCRIVVAVANATTRRMLERIATRLAYSRINIHRAYLDVIDDRHHGSVSLLGFVVEGPDGGPIAEDSDLWREVSLDLLRNKWLDHRALNLAYANPDLGVPRAEVIMALADLTQQLLVKQNSYAFNLPRIEKMIGRNVGPASRIADLFLDRFDPDGPLDDQAFDERLHAVRHEIENAVDLEDARILLKKMVDAIRAVLRTNVHLEHRYGLGMRIDPGFLSTDERAETPFGVFFVHGRGYNGFHVRFRDIARGGLRVIRTTGDEQHGLESERLYDEVYNLAHAQQLKNKDIPEGGAKAAVLLDPYARLDRGVKGFVNSLLDLITPDEAVRSRIVDRFGQRELLYLGPDENITPEFIEWTVERAAQRGYPLPTALMSSKPGAGINHKEYGVTSEGVTVFLDVGLRSIGIDPSVQPFTVKMTGGPDGDVGGNLIRILHRDYGDNARIVGIADGSGCGEDPDGLDHEELLRLQRASLPISHFDRDRLGPKGHVATLEDPDGVHLRNTLHNRIHADAFVPCGGRPNVMHAGNWSEFVDETDRPTGRIIVEGANLFLTPEARTRLSEHGVLIFKDSSANKCGVITSSYEIVSNMLLSETEFLRIKDRFVAEVLAKLREFAQCEAELLVRVHSHHPHVPLPTTSTRLSRVMIRTADAIEESIGTVADQPVVRRLVLDHLPKVLTETNGDRVWTDIPERYLRWIMAKSLAARIVYREGVEFLESMPMAAIAEFALRYLRLEGEREQLAAAVEASSLAERERIAEVLRLAGILPTVGQAEST